MALKTDKSVHLLVDEMVRILMDRSKRDLSQERMLGKYAREILRELCRRQQVRTTVA
jgi:hypothetical protein